MTSQQGLESDLIKWVAAVTIVHPYIVAAEFLARRSTSLSFCRDYESEQLPATLQTPRPTSQGLRRRLKCIGFGQPSQLEFQYDGGSCNAVVAAVPADQQWGPGSNSAR